MDSKNKPLLTQGEEPRGKDDEATSGERSCVWVEGFPDQSTVSQLEERRRGRGDTAGADEAECDPLLVDSERGSCLSLVLTGRDELRGVASDMEVSASDSPVIIRSAAAARRGAPKRLAPSSSAEVDEQERKKRVLRVVKKEKIDKRVAQCASMEVAIEEDTTARSSEEEALLSRRRRVAGVRSDKATIRDDDEEEGIEKDEENNAKRREEYRKAKDYGEEVGQAPGVSTPSRKRDGKASGKGKGSPRASADEQDPGITGLVERKYEEMEAASLGEVLIEHVRNIDEVRRKCKNMQGKLSGQIKRDVAKIEEGINTLVVKAITKGDLGFLRMKVNELMVQSKEKDRKIERLKEELRRASPPGSPPPLRRGRKKSSRKTPRRQGRQLGTTG